MKKKLTPSVAIYVLDVEKVWKFGKLLILTSVNNCIFGFKILTLMFEHLHM